MAKKKDNRRLVRLFSTASGHIYYTVKNFKKTADKLELNKYDPVTRKHEKYIEKK